MFCKLYVSKFKSVNLNNLKWTYSKKPFCILLNQLWVLNFVFLIMNTMVFMITSMVVTLFYVPWKLGFLDRHFNSQAHFGTNIHSCHFEFILPRTPHLIYINKIFAKLIKETNIVLIGCWSLCKIASYFIYPTVMSKNTLIYQINT